GNTTMSHLLLGIHPCAIRVDPYVPAAYSYPIPKAREVGIRVNPHAPLVVVPSVASYVGGDIVAGVLACKIYEREGVSALIDIGTNGEIVLGNKDWLVCCSASAGPAFEGGGISCGMRATQGAIEKVKIEGGDVVVSTIGNQRPKGICGSGLIDAIYELMKNRIIGQDGKFDRSRNDRRLTYENDIPEYILVFEEESATNRPIVITETDIDSLIKSKGAVFAALKCLIDYVGLSFEFIEDLFVAGGFGNYIDPKKAIGIGLLPDIPIEKIKYVGNTSLKGARLCLMSHLEFERALNISRSMTNIELSVYPPFMNEYVAALFLPHTEMRLFPSVNF
ncbi:MAG: ASKHA domain-containing protein, partial [Desulfatiglandales bacterium]